MCLSQSIIDKFYSETEAAYTLLKSKEGIKIITHYAGDLSIGYANIISTEVEELVGEIFERKTVKKRYFTVFIEALQNIRIHGKADGDGQIHSVVTAYRNEKQLCARFGNIVPVESAEFLASRFDSLNKMDGPAVKELYLDVMENGERSVKGGAGLGLITMVMRSKNPCPYELIDLDENYKLFLYTVSVDL